MSILLREAIFNVYTNFLYTEMIIMALYICVG